MAQQRDEQIEYRIYYYASAIDIDAATIKTRATTETNAKVGGKKRCLYRSNRLYHSRTRTWQEIPYNSKKILNTLHHSIRVKRECFALSFYLLLL